MTAPVPGDGRVACPVVTCRNTMPGSGIMCTACWVALPTYQRVSVEACTKAVRRQSTARNKKRLEAAIVGARRTAATVRS